MFKNLSYSINYKIKGSFLPSLHTPSSPLDAGTHPDQSDT